MRGGLVIVVFACFAGLGSARAQPTTDAQRFYEAGRDAYDAGRFEDALRFFQDAYSASPRPALFYNIGLAAERLRRDDLALNAYSKFLQEGTPDPEHAARARERIAVLEADRRARVTPAEPQPHVVEPTPQPPPRVLVVAPTAASPAPPLPQYTQEERYPRAVPALTLAAGALLTVGGVALVGAAVAAKTNAEDPFSDDFYPAHVTDSDRARRRSGAGFTLLGVGVAALLTGIVLRRFRVTEVAVTGTGASLRVSF